jgi:hypothetical protein
MFKKTMKFDDLDGKEVEQTFYFNYNKKEIAELLEFGYISQFRPEDITKRLPLEEQLTILTTPISESGFTQQENNQVAYDIFQDLILDAYGVKGVDNVTFVKDRKNREYFQSHVAFVEMIFEFLENPPEAAQFIEKCLPSKFVEAAKKELEAKGNTGTLAEMVAEADRRQQDPATRIEPGLEAARAALGESPEIEKAAIAIAEGTEKEKTEDLTPSDIEEMDDIAFKKLDVQKLNKEALVAAFKRKSSV